MPVVCTRVIRITRNGFDENKIASEEKECLRVLHGLCYGVFRDLRESSFSTVVGLKVALK